MRVLSTLALLGLLGWSPMPLQAQSLKQTINDLFVFGDCGQPLCLSVGTGHGSHFIPAITQGTNTVIGFLETSIARTVAATPISSTSSGVTYTLVGGLPVPSSSSPGPIFAERAQTLGKGRFFLGGYVTGVNFTSLNGNPLDDISFNFGHQDVDPDTTYGVPDFENDHIAVNMALELNSTSFYLNATWGILDFVDVGVAVPFVRTSMNGTATAQIMPFGNNTVHNFGGDPANPIMRSTTAVSGTASGIGDVVGRLKINLGQSKKFGAALLGEARFPTGNEDDLLGAGFSSIRTMAVGSAQFGDFAPHLNVGYLFRSSNEVNDAVWTAIGFDHRMTDWATVAADLLGSWQVGETKQTLPGDLVYTTPIDRRIPSTSIPNRSEDLLNLSLGMKFRVRGGAILVANIMTPLKKSGMQPDFIWTGGIEGAF
jgi:hypothetical protein